MVIVLLLLIVISLLLVGWQVGKKIWAAGAVGVHSLYSLHSLLAFCTMMTDVRNYTTVRNKETKASYVMLLNTVITREPRASALICEKFSTGGAFISCEH